MIPFDAPFLPDEDGERLLPRGNRDMADLVVEHTDGTYEVNF